MTKYKYIMTNKNLIQTLFRKFSVTRELMSPVKTTKVSLTHLTQVMVDVTNWEACTSAENRFPVSCGGALSIFRVLVFGSVISAGNSKSRMVVSANCCPSIKKPEIWILCKMRDDRESLLLRSRKKLINTEWRTQGHFAGSCESTYYETMFAVWTRSRLLAP